MIFCLQGCHPLWLLFPKQFNYIIQTQLKNCVLWTSNPTTPRSQHTQVITWSKFRLFPFRSPLLRESRCFLFLALLRCFSSCRSLLYPMNSSKDDLGLPDRVSPFGNLRIKAWLTAPRSFWQPSASFIASWCQGIHQMPFSINHKFAGYPFSLST